jgi:hypothetical protein
VVLARVVVGFGICMDVVKPPIRSANRRFMVVCGGLGDLWWFCPSLRSFTICSRMIMIEHNLFV